MIRVPAPARTRSTRSGLPSKATRRRVADLGAEDVHDHQVELVDRAGHQDLSQPGVRHRPVAQVVGANAARTRLEGRPSSSRRASSRATRTLAGAGRRRPARPPRCASYLGGRAVDHQQHRASTGKVVDHEGLEHVVSSNTSWRIAGVPVIGYGRTNSQPFTPLKVGCRSMSG